MRIDYLRISVTDRCNLRCLYCSPLGDCDFIKHKVFLRFEEIQRIVRLFADCGIRKVRLTGGEPLVRKNIAALVEKLAAIAAVKEITMTTNGVLLEQMADANGPAVYFKIKRSAGCLGFISGKSTVFCHLCNRLRLTSDGKVSPCLYSARNYDLKKLIRSGAGDEQILALLEKIISEKRNFTKLNSPAVQFSMRNVGG